MKQQSQDDWLDRVAARRVPPGRRREWAEQLQAQCASPAEKRRLAQELALNDLLDAHRPAPPVSSNFAALVVAEATKSARQTPRHSWAGWITWIAGPRLAASTLAVVLAVAGWHGLQTRQQRTMAREAAEVGRTTAALGLDADALANFEVIRHLGTHARPEDDALMVALAQ